MEGLVGEEVVSLSGALVPCGPELALREASKAGGSQGLLCQLLELPSPGGRGMASMISPRSGWYVGPFCERWGYAGFGPRCHPGMAVPFPLSAG